MQITSILAIYFLFWVFTAFLMLPFGVRTAEEAGQPLVPGQAESAPVNFNPRRLAARATILASVLTALFVVNYEKGWVTMADLDFLPKPPSALAD
ncbi:MAG: DUF1467 family protein [Erythrobacter sp.]|jgi:predicted secreted protein